MTILLLGATGFLGSAVRELLAQESRDYVASSRLPRNGHEICDIADHAELYVLLDRVKPSAIINTAVKADFGAPVHQLFSTNVLAPALIAAWCARHDAYLVQASGTIVHGSRYTLVGTATPVDPDSGYGQSKLLADELCLASGARCAIVRFGGIFGRSGPDHLGLNRAIRAAVLGTPPTVVGKGSARRNYVHVADAAGTLVSCVSRQLTGTYYYGGSETLTIAEMMQDICATFLRGASPTYVDGAEAHHQIVESSPALLPARPFRIALEGERDR